MRDWKLFTAALALACLCATAPSARTTTASASTDCAGDACAAVSVAFDEEKGQYKVRNESAERWVLVAASNAASAASACVGPGRSDYLPLKSVVGPVRASYSAPGCGQ